MDGVVSVSSDGFSSHGVERTVTSRVSRRAVVLLLAAVCASCAPDLPSAAVPASASQHPQADGRYLGYVTAFANTLLSAGLDTVGVQRTDMWAGVIHAPTLTIPASGVPALAGVREEDRAVGGANLYHDATTLRAFRALSAVTGDLRFAAAASDYVRAFFQSAQSPVTGFLAWGEHLYYNFYEDRVVHERNYHELLEWTPPWAVLWEVDAAATTRAISALRYHFAADDPTVSYNRHGHFNSARHNQVPRNLVKHAGLYAYSFAFLHRRTGDPRWLAWSRGPAASFWAARNPLTDLTPSLFEDTVVLTPPTPNMALLAYWMVKASEQNPGETVMRRRGIAFMRAFGRAFHDPDGYYHYTVTMDGTPNADRMPVWGSGYAVIDLQRLGRAAAYVARVTGDPESLAIAKRAASFTRQAPRPPRMTAENFGFGINLLVDLYELTGRTAYLDQARSLADAAIENLWVGTADRGFFVRATGDPYYESKHGAGDLLAGLLRLHLKATRQELAPAFQDWSF